MIDCQWFPTRSCSLSIYVAHGQDSQTHDKLPGHSFIFLSLFHSQDSEKPPIWLGYPSRMLNDRNSGLGAWENDSDPTPDEMTAWWVFTVQTSMATSIESIIILSMLVVNIIGWVFRVFGSQNRSVLGPIEAQWG